MIKKIIDQANVRNTIISKVLNYRKATESVC